MPPWAAVALVAAAMWLLWHQVRTPLEGPFRHGFLGHNAGRYALAGRNYVRHGFSAHLGAPDLTPGRTQDPPHLYLHHPPLAPLLVGAAFAALGESERSAELPFVACAMLLPLAMYWLARACLRGGGPAAAAVFTAVVPMTMFYGGHVDPQGPFVLLSVILQVGAWLRFRATRSAGWLAVSLAALLLGLLSDWSAAYAAGFLWLLDRRGGARDRRIRLLPFAAVAFVAAYVAWLLALGRSPWEELIHSAGVRSSGIFDDAAALKGALAGRARDFVALHLWPVVALAALALLPPIRRAVAKPEGGLGRAILALLFTGAVHVALFPQGALVHDYWTYLFQPSLALAAAASFEAVRAVAARKSGEGFGVLTALLLLGGTAWLGNRAAAEKYGSSIGPIPYATLGQATREFVRPDERLLTNLAAVNPVSTRLLGIPEFAYYADRVTRGGVGDEAALDRAIAEEGPFQEFLWAPLGAGVPALLEPVLRTRYGSPREIALPGGKLLLFTLPR